jgi:hypothetical protein
MSDDLIDAEIVSRDSVSVGKPPEFLCSATLQLAANGLSKTLSLKT